MANGPEMQRKGAGALDLSPPRRLRLHSVDCQPNSHVDVIANLAHDDNDTALQAALLASIAAEDQGGACTPALVNDYRGIANPGKTPHSDTSLAARTLQTLALDPPALAAQPSVVDLPPSAAGVLHKCPILH